MKGEIGCYLSHLYLLKKIANSDYDGWTIIFEDDLVLDNTFKDELHKILIDLDGNENVDMIYLGNTSQNHCKKGLFKNNLCYPDTPYGTQAYMVNKRSAQKIYELIKFVNNPIDVNYDLLMKSGEINGLVVIPTLVNQNQENQSMIV
jgi:GR25 family glycosyltransferase involved in LPS biosynthesis